MKLASLVLMVLGLMIGVSKAQTVTGSGTVGAIPQFTGSSTVGNSPISVSGSNVGIGTTNPSYMLHVNGEAFADGGFRVSSSNGDDVNGAPWYGLGQAPNLSLWDGHSQTVQLAGYYGLNFRTGNGQMVMRGDTGNVGIKTATPMGVFDVNGTGGLVVSSMNLDPQMGYSLLPLKNSGKLLIGWNRLGGNGEIDLISNRGPGDIGGFMFYDYTNEGILNPLVAIKGNGNVGIGTTNPSARMEVNGGIKLTGNGNFITFPDGSTQGSAYTGVLCGGDYAESIDVTGDRTSYAPGDVLVIDSDTPGKFLKSAEPYSTAVMGVYSTKPGVLGRRQTTPKSADEVPMAMVGIVPTKVSAENGAIKPGDLLVTSSTLGYAMKGTDRSRMLGAVIGKALAGLDSGNGIIEVGITLQ